MTFVLNCLLGLFYALVAFLVITLAAGLVFVCLVMWADMVRAVTG